MVLDSANGSLGHITAVIICRYVLQGDGWGMCLAVLHEKIGVFIVHPLEGWRDTARLEEISAVCVSFDILRLPTVFHRFDVDVVATDHDHEVLRACGALDREPTGEVMGSQIGGREKLGETWQGAARARYDRWVYVSVSFITDFTYHWDGLSLLGAPFPLWELVHVPLWCGCGDWGVSPHHVGSKSRQREA